MTKKYGIIQKGQDWYLGRLKRKKIETLLARLERKILTDLGVDKDIKLAVTVKYDNGTTNETLNSRDMKEIMFPVVCFVEDFISKTSFRIWSKKYSG